ncbi:MAG: Nif3-like dinuclear metal center hexameric protein [Oscillospiraceae bacterium]|jgi:dinuclear metal center YbgI/SA1388 family protein|nr:Nif3-like dinuclear metal center hexameric protein [Oscillospiraceae bacterium]
MKNSTYTVSDVLAAVEKPAPFALCEDWDNSGLLVGDANSPADKIGVCLDISSAQIEQAQRLEISCIVSHHPVIFRPEEPRFLAPNPAYLLARAGISAIAAHTNLDSAGGGVNDVLAEIIGLQNIKLLQETPTTGRSRSQLPAAMLRMGELPEELSAADFAHLAAERLSACVRYADGGKPIRRVAVCGGSGGEFVKDCARLGFDAYLTGEARHHEFLAARAGGITLLAAGHYETEAPVVERLAAALRDGLPGAELIVLDEENPVLAALNAD